MFEDIKVGDKILLSKDAESFPFNTGKRFAVGVAVEKVTPKRFVADGSAFDKKTGRCHGGYGKAEAYCQEKDQVKEFEEENQRVKLAIFVSRRLYDRKRDEAVKILSREDSMKILRLSKEIQSILDGYKKD